MSKKKKGKPGGPKTTEAPSNVTPFTIKPAAWFQEPEEDEEDWEDGGEDWEDDEPFGGDLPGGMSPYMMDRAIRLIDEYARNTKTSDEEVGEEDFFKHLTSDPAFQKRIATPVPDTPEDMACELASMASFMEEGLPQRILFRAALMLDPDNLAAAVEIVDDGASSAEERIEKLRVLLRRAEEGDPFPDPDRPQRPARSLLSARTYWNACLALVDELAGVNRLDEAIETIEAALRLDPLDIGNVSERLLALYLAKKRLENARDLLEKLDDDEEDAAFLRWARVLERFLSGDLTEAAKLYRQANRSNSVVADYLTGRKPVPSDEDEMDISDPDDFEEEEAIAYMETFAVAWDAHPEAKEWLKTVSKKRK